MADRKLTEEILPDPKKLDADTIVDAVVPETIDWRTTVRNHPVASVGSLAVASYLVGRTKGPAILAGLTTAVSAALLRYLSDVFEGDFLDFD